MKFPFGIITAIIIVLFRPAYAIAQDSTLHNYNKVLAEALFLQLKADSLSRISREKRILARETPDAGQKQQLTAGIIQTDRDAEACQIEADRKFAEARELKISFEKSAEGRDPMVSLSGEVNGISLYQYRAEHLPAMEEATPVGKDEFAILERPAYNESKPIPPGLDVFAGLVYRIQMGAFSTIRPDDAFGGITPVCYEQGNGTNVYKYYAGLFYSSGTVAGALERVRACGFADAFVVAFHNGKIISTEKAREIEFARFKL